MNIEQVFRNNGDWIAEKLAEDRNYFRNLSQGQNPDMLYIGCSDSRVCPEDLMGLEPGEVFVHRNIANLIANTDLNVMTVVDYAVSHLEVGYIIVCGHYGCGGVRAAMQNEDLGVLNPWLKNIWDVYRIHQKELDKIEDEEKRYNRLVELNVREQCINLIKNRSVRQAHEKGWTEIYGWVFDIKSGSLKNLCIDLTKAHQTLRQSFYKAPMEQK